MKERFVQTIGLVALMAMLGAGCTKEPSTVVGAPSSNGTTTKNAPARALTQAEIRAELNSALQKFADTKSFKAKLTVPSPDGNITSVIQFAKPNRFQATVGAGTQAPTEIIVVNSSLYIRLAGQKWVNLTGTKSAKAMSESLQESLTGDQSLDKLTVDDSVIVKKSFDGRRACDAYTTTFNVKDTGSQQAIVCVKNGFPAFFDLLNGKQTVTIEYYDFNSVIVIEKPM